ncbi:hypothetical protein G6M89_03060 [Natronolimnobius sp. AArcel1]|uniref:hypothetical protein n=1 Tax=Natronolimnobius sp. AArcel1 TaxID=1679093 RepID=UPI0013ED79C4|nr:hypothetical protein [Natronolimnobius sp. AArcel1]NGM68003.1 hypothetical protein [Natronolimnobius sp. AArcel1]
MNRRRLLTFVAGGAIGCISGCLTQLAGETYEVCEAPVIMYSDLPDAAREEVDSALETGEYETDGELLWSAITQSEPELFTGDALYHSNVGRAGDVSRLQFERDEGSYRSLTVANETADDLTVTVTVASENATDPLQIETVALGPDEDTQWRRTFPGYGEYEIFVDTDSRSETLVWDYPPSAWNSYDSPRVAIGSANIEL